MGQWISMKNKVEKGRCNLTLVFSSIQSNWFLKRHQMSTSRRNYWFFDTTQQEIFICVQLRPRTNRWGLTSAEWQIPTPPIPFIPKGLEVNAALSSVLAHAHYNYCSQINKGFPPIYDPCQTVREWPRCVTSWAGTCTRLGGPHVAGGQPS